MMKLAERYKLNSFIIQGEVLRPPMAEFVFSNGGTFVNGSIEGEWTRTDDLVRLSNRFASWGDGRLSDEGRVLVFQYTQDGVEFCVVLNRVEEKKR